MSRATHTVATRVQNGSAGILASWRTRERAFAVLLVLLALRPYLVLLVTRIGHLYTPEGDNGTIDLRVRDVWSLHPPLVGPYSTFGWNHPGPLLFYAPAIPSLLSGFAAWGTQVGGALLQGLAVVWLAWLAWRRGRLPLLGVTMVGVGLLALATSPFVVRNPWNPYVPFPFFALLTADLEGIDHRAAKELVALDDRAARRGGPRSAIFSFTPAAAPGALVGG